MRRDLPSSLVVQGSPWSVYPKIVSQEQPRSILIPSITGGTGLLSPASNGKTVDVIFRNRVSNGPIDADDVARAEFAIPKDPHHSSFSFFFHSSTFDTITMRGMMSCSVLLAALWIALGIVTPSEGLVHHHNTQVCFVPRLQIKGAVPLMSSSSTTRILANRLPSARNRPSCCRPICSAKTKLFSDMPNDNIPSSETSTSQTRYAIGYRVFSAAYLLQILLAIRKTGGVTLAVANVAGGPLLASGLVYLLATMDNASQQNQFSRDTTLRLNGLIALYSSLGLVVGLVPQCHSFSWWLYFGTSFSVLSLSVLGYIQGVDPAVQGQTVSTETLRLTKEAQHTTFAMPQNVASFGYSCALAVIASCKGLLCLEIFNRLLLPSSSSSSIAIAIAANVSRFAKLTVLGGTIVILKDAAHRGRLDAKTFRVLNLLSAIVLGSTAGKFTT